MWQQILAKGVSQYVYVGSEFGKNSDVIVERPKSFFDSIQEGGMYWQKI